MELSVVRKTETSKLPQKAHMGDLGYDVFADESVFLNPGERSLISTGIAIKATNGKYGFILKDRSSMAVKGLFSHAGVIDAGYTGEIKVLLYNASNKPYEVIKGDKIAQMIPTQVVSFEVYKNKEDYQRSDSIKEEQTFNQYLDNLNNYTIDSHDPGLESGDKLIYLPDCSLNTLYLRSNISEELFGDLHNSEDTIIGLDYPVDYYLYLGIDTKSGTHLHVEEDYMMNQIIGKKKIYCLDYEQLHLNNFFHKYNNFSKENFFKLDWDKYDIYYAELEPGDSFCFPPWMWHAVESDGYTLGMVKVFERNEDYYKKYHRLRMRYMLNTQIPNLYNDAKDWLQWKITGKN